MPLWTYSQQRYEPREAEETEEVQADPNLPSNLSCEEHIDQEQSDSSRSLSPNTTPPSLFLNDGPPSPAVTVRASYLPVLTEDGSSIPFGTVLFNDEGTVGEAAVKKPPVKTIVCFIRYFLCPLCQDYMYSIGRNISPEALEQAGLRLVIVGNGGWEMIKSYRRIFKLPYPVYTDPTAALHSALGMTQVGPSSSSSTLQAYVRHDGLVSGIAHVLKNAMKARMPIWKNVGRKELLGGEYVFVRLSEKDIQCIWAHRMCNTAGHEEITDVMYHAAKSVFVRSNQGVVPDCESTNRTSNSSATAGEQVQLPFSDADALLDPATSPSVSPEDDTESWSIDESFEASSEDTKRSEWRSTRDSQFLVLREKKRRRRVGGLADFVAAEEGESEGLGKGKGDREEGPDADEVNIYSTR